MPRNPKATKPKEKIAVDAGSMIDARPELPPTREIMYATAISPPIVTPPTQNPEKLPAVSPLSTLSDAPPSLLAVTTSRTCRLWVEVKILVTSGMTAPASVPQVMIVARIHQRSRLPLMPPIRVYDAA